MLPTKDGVVIGEVIPGPVGVVISCP
jgi:hypothetical protein